MSFILISASLIIILFTRLSELISNVKKRTGIFIPAAALSAMLIAKAVLPKAGLEPITMRSPFCHPPITLSNKAYPLEMPLLLNSCSISGFIFKWF